MFLSRNKKTNVYPCKPQFYYIKEGFKGVKIIYACFRDERFVKRTTKTRIRLNAQSDLSLRWAHMSEGTFSHSAPHLIQCFRNLILVHFMVIISLF